MPPLSLIQDALTTVLLNCLVVVQRLNDIEVCTIMCK